MTRTLLSLPAALLSATLLLAVPAHAGPPEDTAIDKHQIESLLEMSDALSLMARELGEAVSKDGRVHTLIDDPDALREAARDMERMIDEADVLEGLAELAIVLSERVEVVETGDAMTLNFDGREIASVEADGTDRVSIRAGGRRITVETD